MFKAHYIGIAFLAVSRLASADCIMSCSISDDTACIYALAVGEDCEKSGPVSFYFYNDKEERISHETDYLSVSVPKSKKQIIKQIKPTPVGAKSCEVSWSRAASTKLVQ